MSRRKAVQPARTVRFTNELSRPNIKTWSWIVAGFVTWLTLVYLPHQVMTPNLDASWEGALSYFAQRHLQFGTEIIFTYGPLGYLVPENNDGILIERKLVVELLMKLFVTLVLVWVARRIRFWNRLLFLVFIWILAPRFGNSYPEVLLYFCAAAAGMILCERNRWQYYLAGVIVAFLAFVSLIKFTLLVYAGVIVVLSIVFWAWKRDWRLCILIPLTYVAFGAIGWIIAGQKLANIPAWIGSSLQIASGYEQSMGIDPKSGILPAALATAAVAMLILGFSVFFARKNLSACVPLAGLAAGYWIAWKHGLVRADDHVNLFFGFSLLGFLSFSAFSAEIRSKTRLIPVACSLGCVLCLGGIYIQTPDFLTQAPIYFVSNFIQTARDLIFLKTYESSMDARLSEEAKKWDCPNIRAAVGAETVDVFGFTQAVALFNNLNYRPRPIFQGYCAYTPRLIRINGDFYRSDRAPPYIISSFNGIDGHLPTEEDSEAWRVLLLDYHPYVFEKGWLLWKRSAFPKAPNEEITDTQSAITSFSHEETVTSENLWCTVDIRETFLGRLRSFFYKPPMVFISIVDNSHRRTIYRLLPTVAKDGFILDPCLLSLRDVFWLKTGQTSNLLRTSGFSLLIDDSARKYFQNQIGIQLSRMPGLAETANGFP